MSKSDEILGKYQEKLIKRQQGYEEESDNDDELLELLEDDQEFDRYREQRIQELSDQFKQSKRNVEEGYGSVQTVLSEEQILQITTNTKLTVVHFFHPNFTKCQVMDSKLEILAQKHISTKFIRINVDNAPFLVTRLKIKVLPVVLLYINGVESNRLIGFDKLSYNSSSADFSIESLEKFLLDNGAIQRKANSYQRIGKAVVVEDEEDDLDL